MKKMKMLLVTLFLTLSMGITAFAGEWKQDTTGWWYQNDDGSYPTDVFKKIDYNWFYFGSDGYMKTGWYQFEDGWFGFSEDGYAKNPTDLYTGQLLGGPYKGWISYSGSYESTINDIANGSVTYFNGQYWCDPDAYQEEIVYEHDVAPEPVKDRFGLADMQL